ncbi:MAG: hypothetical protein AAF125_23450, partial [Chloroflexota bacterium]
SPYTLTACTSVSLEVLWRSMQNIDMTLSLATVLVGPDGQAAARADGAPAGVQTTQLRPDDLFSGIERIDTCDLDPGEYALTLGLYPAGETDALPPTSADGTPLQNQVYLTTITVTE